MCKILLYSRGKQEMQLGMHLCREGSWIFFHFLDKMLLLCNSWRNMDCIYLHISEALCFGTCLLCLSPHLFSVHCRTMQNYFCWRKCSFCPKCTALRSSACHMLMINRSASDLPESRQCGVSTPFIIVVYGPQTHSLLILRL